MASSATRTRRWTVGEYERMAALGILGEDEGVELIAGQIVLKGRYPLVERRWTREEHDRLVEAGLLRPGDRVALVGDGLLCREPQGSLHATAVDLAADALRGAFGAGWTVRTEKPLLLGEESEPEPDVAVVAGARRDYREAHPRRAALVVEVAESSLEADRTWNCSVYARAGVPEYWIVNLVDGVVEVYRDPGLEPGEAPGWRYAARQILEAGRDLAPLAAPTGRIPVSDLLP